MMYNTNCRDQSFPRICPDCGKEEVKPEKIAYDAKVKHDGRQYALHILDLLVNKCSACGEVFFDSVASGQIYQALRNHLKLLSPQEIKERLNALGLTQKDFAKQIRVAPETICRWLSGEYIQSCSSDALMRMFFEREEAKQSALQSGEVSIQLGEMATWSHQALFYTEVVSEPALDTISPHIPALDSLGADIPLEMTRGPPICEPIINNLRSRANSTHKNIATRHQRTQWKYPQNSRPSQSYASSFLRGRISKRFDYCVQRSNQIR